jgi:hypothetical protein
MLICDTTHTPALFAGVYDTRVVYKYHDASWALSTQGASDVWNALIPGRCLYQE